MSARLQKKPKGHSTLVSFLIDESRIAEILRQLQTQHEKFCPWPDFPCPGRSNSVFVFMPVYIQ